MSTTPTNASHLRTEAPVDPTDHDSDPQPSQRDGAELVLLGVVTLASGAFLVAMFASMAQGGSPSPWGPINDTLSAGGHVLLAVLVPRLSRRAARTPRTRGFVRFVVGASVAAAASGLLLVAGVLPFEPSTAISMVGIFAQSAWMAWLNGVWSRSPQVPPTVWRLGMAVGYGLPLGLVLAGASLLLPWGSVAANALLIPGLALGGAIWLIWPLWYLLLGRHLYRAAREADAEDDPTTARR